MTAQKYSRPPITEAVIQVRLPSPVGASDLAKLTSLFRKKYAHVEPLRVYNANVDFAVGTVAIEPTDTGTKFMDAGGTNIRIFNGEGLIASRLAPYPGWDVFIDPIAEDISNWADALSAQHTYCKLGLRFVNRIDVREEEHADASDLFHLYPHPVHALLGKQSEFLLIENRRLDFHSCNAKVSVGNSVPPFQGIKSYTLDIDVSQQEQTVKLSAMWPVIAHMRETKNQIFEACITDKARELFYAAG